MTGLQLANLLLEDDSLKDMLMDADQLELALAGYDYTVYNDSTTGNENVYEIKFPMPLQSANDKYLELSIGMEENKDDEVGVWTRIIQPSIRLYSVPYGQRLPLDVLRRWLKRVQGATTKYSEVLDPGTFYEFAQALTGAGLQEAEDPLKDMLLNTRGIELALDRWGFKRDGRAYGAPYWKVTRPDSELGTFSIRVLDYRDHGYAVVSLVHHRRDGKTFHSTGSYEVQSDDMPEFIKRLIAYMEPGFLTPNEALRSADPSRE